MKFAEIGLHPTGRFEVAMVEQVHPFSIGDIVKVIDKKSHFRFGDLFTVKVISKNFIGFGDHEYAEWDPSHFELIMHGDVCPTKIKKDKLCMNAYLIEGGQC